MPLQFTQARAVTAGEPVSAGDMASLAEAVNSRLRSGVGDMHWRIAFFLFSGLFRKMRRDNGTLATPEAEFFNFYQAVNPDSGAFWPLSPPGEPEGANLANHLNAFVFGSEALDIESERVRLGNIPSDLPDNATAAMYWELGKSQRGAYDPLTGDYSSPIFALGTSYGYIRSAITSQHGNSYGGYFPTAYDADGCLPDAEGFYPPNLQIFFTNLQTGAVQSYCGTCPDDVGGTCPDAERVYSVAYTPWAYVVFRYNGAVDYLPKSQWIEGPYTTDARLSKASANALSRAVAEYAAEFRGSTQQRSQADGGQPDAFLMQEFLTESYCMAPQIGVTFGEDVVPFYPTFGDVAGSDLTITGGPLPFNAGGAKFTAPEGSICTHIMCAVAGLASDSVTITVKSGSSTLVVATLQRNDSGNVSDIIRLPIPTLLSDISVECTEARFASADGNLRCELNCVLDYKPQLYDAYALIRLSTYRGGLGKDGFGIDEDQAREVYTKLKRFCCIAPLASPQMGLDIAVNGNAVYEAARQLSKSVRILPRQQLVGYAVSGGKSVIYLRRYAMGMSHDVPIDLLEGIAPRPDYTPSGELIIGRTYSVDNGNITHGAKVIHRGQLFTAISKDYEGPGQAFEDNGIYDAHIGGFSNRWVFDATFRTYYWSDSSIWKPDSFADVVSPFIDRCTMDDVNISSDKTTLLHMTYGIAPAYHSETPSGYRYVPTPLSSYTDYANYGASTSFQRSCRVYEPPLRVISATIDGQMSSAFGEQIIRVRMDSRLHHHHSLAPSAIDVDISTWNTADLDAEVADYRTAENAIREYILYDQTGKNCGNAGAGDAASTSSLPTSGDVFGTCFPSLIFVREIPSPWLDGNKTYESSDSPALSDHQRLTELYLRAGCEGFVDGRTSAEMACKNGTVTLFDYTFENLNYDASANRWVPILPTSVRPDNAFGHGPMPMTQFYAATHNALANAVNRLTTVRLMVPADLESRTTTRTETVDVTSDVRLADGQRAVDAGTWSLGGSSYALWTRAATSSAGTASTGAWTPGASTSVSSSTRLFFDGTNATLENTSQTVEWRWAPHSGFEYSLPEDFAAVADATGSVLLQKQDISTSFERSVVSGEFNGTQCHGSGGADNVWSIGTGTGQAVEWVGTVTTADPVCEYKTEPIDSKQAGLHDVWLSEDIIGPPFPDCIGQNQISTNMDALVVTPAVKIPTVAWTGGD